jgi:hypothetical protein
MQTLSGAMYLVLWRAGCQATRESNCPLSTSRVARIHCWPTMRHVKDRTQDINIDKTPAQMSKRETRECKSDLFPFDEF